MRALSLAPCLLSLACSWSRFDDVQDNASVVLLEEPGAVGSGFGSSLATISTADDAHVLVAAARGSHGAAQYRVGFGQSPVVDTIDGGHCRPDCALGSTVAGMATAAVPGGGTRSFCWATGISPAGVVGRCRDDAGNVDYTLPIPPAVTIDPAARFVLASDTAEQPALLAAGDGSAWFHPPVSTNVVELSAPAAGAGFGDAAAIARVQTGRVLAVGAPEAGELWLFASSDSATVDSHGCVTGPPGLGRSIAAGDVDGDGFDELVVAAADAVVVLALSQGLATGGGCVDAGGAVLANLTCKPTADVTGCAASRFGEALAVGDLNGDGNGEVVVGAPGMNARDASGGGALLVFDVDLTGATDAELLTDAKFLSSAGGGDALGASVAAVRQADRHVLLGGGPGGDKAALFYCFELPSGKRGARCQ